MCSRVVRDDTQRGAHSTTTSCRSLTAPPNCRRTNARNAALWYGVSIWNVRLQEMQLQDASCKLWFVSCVVYAVRCLSAAGRYLQTVGCGLQSFWRNLQWQLQLQFSCTGEIVLVTVTADVEVHVDTYVDGIFTVSVDVMQNTCSCGCARESGRVCGC